jgi:hypothetical protein
MDHVRHRSVAQAPARTDDFGGALGVRSLSHTVEQVERRNIRLGKPESVFDPTIQLHCHPTSAQGCISLASSELA